MSLYLYFNSQGQDDLFAPFEESQGCQMILRITYDLRFKFLLEVGETSIEVHISPMHTNACIAM